MSIDKLSRLADHIAVADSLAFDEIDLDLYRDAEGLE